MYCPGEEIAKMAGTTEGGKAAAKRNKELYGAGFYATIGRLGGKAGHTGGFFVNRELARTAGAKGGTVSRRGPWTAGQRAAYQAKKGQVI